MVSAYLSIMPIETEQLTMSSPPSSSVNRLKGSRIPTNQGNFSCPSTACFDGNLQPGLPQSSCRVEEDHSRLLDDKRQQSKSGLRSLFGLERSIRRPKNGNKTTGVGKLSLRAPALENHPSTDTPLPSPNTCQTAFSGSTLVSSNLSVDPAGIPETPNRTRGRSRSIKSSANKASWKPPPLCQAYPQAIKHSRLPLPVTASLTESILRPNGTGRKSAPGDAGNSSGNRQQANDSANDSPQIPRRKESRSTRRLRSSSRTGKKTEWTTKIYIFAAAGYLLQYSASGKFDRLPEKMMRLGPKSVAFASDVIPGKPLVLQVFQHFDEESMDTAVVNGGVPIFSRIGSYRPLSRWTRNFLLVFDSPEVMHSWLVALRMEIELSGGRKCEIAEPPDCSLHQQPDFERPARRHFDQLSELSRQSQRWENDSSMDYHSRRTSISCQSANRPSFTSYSDCHSARQIDELSVDGSENTYAFSKAQRSALDNSDSFSLLRVPGMSQPQDVASLARAQVRTPPPSPSQTHSPASPDVQLSRQPSTTPEVTGRCVSPAAPNFSVPSFSKKSPVRSGRQPPNSKYPQRLPTPLTISYPPHVPVSGDFMNNSAAFAAFPTPPHTPNLSPSIPSPVRKDSVDKLSTVSRDSSVKKKLAVSTSQDSLSEVAQRSTTPNGIVELRAQTPSRSPRVIVSTSPVPAHRNNINLSPPATPKDASFPGVPQRSRNPSLGRQPETSSTSESTSASRTTSRNGLTGLSMGPPTLPPPTCPLPRIPSVGQQPEPCPPAPSFRLCRSPTPKTSPETRKTSVKPTQYADDVGLSAKAMVIRKPTVHTVNVA